MFAATDPHGPQPPHSLGPSVLFASLIDFLVRLLVIAAAAAQSFALRKQTKKIRNSPRVCDLI